MKDEGETGANEKDFHNWVISSWYLSVGTYQGLGDL